MNSRKHRMAWSRDNALYLHSESPRLEFRTSDILTEDLRDIPQSHQANCRTVPLLNHDRLLLNPYQNIIHQSNRSTLCNRRARQPRKMNGTKTAEGLDFCQWHRQNLPFIPSGSPSQLGARIGSSQIWEGSRFQTGAWAWHYQIPHRVISLSLSLRWWGRRVH